MKTLTAWVLLISSVAAMGEVTLDGTVGPTGPLSGPNFVIPDTVGLTQGPNLFHSFDSFNINAGESATFTGPAVIDHVISRVTGGDPSDINGPLRSTIPSADLWFVNPAGVLFGQNASLDIDGSFHVSTADYVRLGNGGRVDATNPSQSSFTLAPPEAFGFLGPTAASIRVTSSDLSVPEGETLSLVGGNIEIFYVEGDDFYNDFSTLSAPGGLNLVSTASKGEVLLTPDRLDVSSFPVMGDINLNGLRATSDGGDVRIFGSQVNLEYVHILSVGSDSAGDIVIEAEDLRLDLSEIRSESVAGNSGSITVRADTVELNQSSITTFAHAGDGGEIMVEAGSVRLQGYCFSGACIGSLADADGNAGDVTIRAGTIELLNGANISTETFGTGDGGDILVEAVSLRLEHGADIQTGSEEFSHAGNAGNITVRADSVELLMYSTISADNYGSGDGGDILIEAGSLWLDDSDIESDSYYGNAGDITIRADNVDLLNASSVTAYGSGGGGDVLLEAHRLQVEGDRITGNWSAISSASRDDGNAGNVTIRADAVELFATRIFSSAFLGNGGDVLVEARTVRMDGGGIAFSEISTSTYGAGDAGDVTLRADTVELLNNVIVFSDTRGTGSGGSVTVEAESIRLEGGKFLDENEVTRQIVISVNAYGAGDAGNINLRAGMIELLANSLVLAGTYGEGSAGNILLQADIIRVDGADSVYGSLVSANSESSGSGNGGNIRIEAGTLEILNDARINASTFGSGDGGEIHISANSVQLSDNALIEARSDGTGRAGGIVIEAETLFESFDSVVSTESLFSDGGNITLNVGEMIYLEDSSITTSVGSGEGTGGNISIDPVFVILIDSDITANAFGGPGGNISIVAENFFADEDSVVQASSQLGVSGTVAIKTPDSDVTESLVVLPESFLDATALLSQRCGSQSSAERSSLVMGGPRDLPPEPAGNLIASAAAYGVGAEALTADIADVGPALAGQGVECR